MDPKIRFQIFILYLKMEANSAFEMWCFAKKVNTKKLKYISAVNTSRSQN
jgi:hypothetical protein